MKNLIFINGTMGCGKTAVSRELQKLLPDCVFLDGDWCWDSRPFIVNDETKAMVVDNISALLGAFLRCQSYRSVVFCWVMHEQEIMDSLLSRLDLSDCRTEKYTLMIGEKTLRERLQKDVDAGIRSPDVIERSVARLGCYPALNTRKLCVDSVSAAEAARLIFEDMRSSQR